MTPTVCWPVAGARCREADNFCSELVRLLGSGAGSQGSGDSLRTGFVVAQAALSSCSALWAALAESLHLGPGGCEQRWEVSDVDRLQWSYRHGQERQLQDKTQERPFQISLDLLGVGVEESRGEEGARWDPGEEPGGRDAVIFLKKGLFMAVLSFGCCGWAFSSCSEWWLLSSRRAWASHRCGFSCCGAWALGAQWLQLWALEWWLSSCGARA